MADHTATCSSQSCCVFHSGVRGTVFESDVCRRAVRAMNLSADDTDFFKAFTHGSIWVRRDRLPTASVTEREASI